MDPPNRRLGLSSNRILDTHILVIVCSKAARPGMPIPRYVRERVVDVTAPLQGSLFSIHARPVDGRAQYFHRVEGVVSSKLLD